MQVIGSWLTHHIKDTNICIAKAKAYIRGCDLWTRESRQLIWELAYSGEYAGEKPIDVFRKARWRLWGELDEDEKQQWNLKGEMARQMVKGDLTEIIPPKLSFR